MHLSIYAIPKTKITYENSNGKKISVKPTSKFFKIINYCNPASYWAGKHTMIECRDLHDKIDIDAFLDNCPKIVSFEAIPGGKVYTAFNYLFSEDFRTIDDGMIETFDLIQKDLNKLDNIEFSHIRDFLVSYKDCKIFSVIE